MATTDRSKMENNRRVESLKEQYVDGVITEEEFDTLLEAAIKDESPYRVDWFMEKMRTRRKRYAEQDIYLYNGEEFVVDGEFVVREDEEEIDRTINVRDSPDRLR
jgi:hypothetical protein